MNRPVPPSFDTVKASAFISRWRASEASERANAQSFASELCDLLGVERPRPKVGVPSRDTYCFEREVTVTHPDGQTSTNFIDLYKRGYFVFESKQGSEARRSEEAKILPLRATAKRGTAVRGTGGYDTAMQNAYVQAERYARALDEWPPFLVVCDVGFCFELYASFDGSGKYRHFPAPGEHRIPLERLAEPHVFTLLYDVFTEPLARDPSLEAAKVTREIAANLARLAVSLEASGHTPELVAKFLMRCLFTMFAEDVGLLPPAAGGQHLFTYAIEHDWIPHPERFSSQVEALWRAMNSGGDLFGVAGKILQFNGGLFADPIALPMSREQLQILQFAALSDWTNVEPAIFGTLLERALDPKERHRLGAHFTPRAYVERLVSATIEEPIRDEWNLVRAQVLQLVTINAKPEEAKKVLKNFHKRLCSLRVLDPACGTGNFLYVTLDLFKRIEAEILSELADLGEKQLLLDVQSVTVTPGQFLGIEVKHWAREIADLVLWIGYLQWHHRTRGRVQPAEPVLKDFKNIVCRDALMDWDAIEAVVDENGKPLTRWDGETFKRSKVTGEDVPDEAAVVPLTKYVGARPAEWPDADFVIGNPPFVGTRRMRLTLTDGYVDALAETWPAVAENADFVMYWWHHAAELARAKKIRRFGFITTNSITQSFNRSVLHLHLEAKESLSIVFAIPDHPWVDSTDGAAVRVALTAAQGGPPTIGSRYMVVDENARDELSVSVTLGAPLVGRISEDLRVGASPAAAAPLESNTNVAFWGVKFYGDGFIVTQEEAETLAAAQGGRSLARPFVSGRDLTGHPRGLYAIDCDGLDEATLAQDYPPTYQRLLERVKPVRAHNPRAFKRERWWIFGENQPGMRRAVAGLERYIATTETAKHRVFHFFDGKVLAEGTVAVLAFDDSFHHGILSSRVHVTWALAAGGRLGVGNDPRYNKTRCFDPFPFPDCGEEHKIRVRELAERLDGHRKRQQSLYPTLTTTDVYNVLEKLRRGEELTDADRRTNEAGLVSILRQIHDELDWAVFDAYGWAVTLSDEQILERLITLNSERADEERRGVVRWLRPDFQNPSGSKETPQATEGETATAETPTASTARPWPKSVPEQLGALKALFESSKSGFSVDETCAQFKGARRDKVLQHLESLESLGLLTRYRVGKAEHWHS